MVLDLVSIIEATSFGEAFLDTYSLDGQNVILGNMTLN